MLFQLCLAGVTNALDLEQLQELFTSDEALMPSNDDPASYKEFDDMGVEGDEMDVEGDKMDVEGDETFDEEAMMNGDVDGMHWNATYSEDEMAQEPPPEDLNESHSRGSVDVWPHGCGDYFRSWQSSWQRHLGRKLVDGVRYMKQYRRGRLIRTTMIQVFVSSRWASGPRGWQATGRLHPYRQKRCGNFQRGDKLVVDTRGVHCSKWPTNKKYMANNHNQWEKRCLYGNYRYDGYAYVYNGMGLGGRKSFGSCRCYRKNIYVAPAERGFCRLQHGRQNHGRITLAHGTNRDQCLKKCLAHPATASPKTGCQWRHHRGSCSLHTRAIDMGSRTGGKRCWVFNKSGRPRHCAMEHKMCRCTGLVLYGRLRSIWGQGIISLNDFLKQDYRIMHANGAIHCANDKFDGGDPAPGHFKQCLCVTAAPSNGGTFAGRRMEQPELKLLEQSEPEL